MKNVNFKTYNTLSETMEDAHYVGILGGLLNKSNSSVILYAKDTVRDEFRTVFSNYIKWVTNDGFVMIDFSGKGHPEDLIGVVSDRLLENVTILDGDVVWQRISHWSVCDTLNDASLCDGKKGFKLTNETPMLVGTSVTTITPVLPNDPGVIVFVRKHKDGTYNDYKAIIEVGRGKQVCGLYNGDINTIKEGRIIHSEWKGMD